jgi:glycine/D-amino acid oxidase-like deaminating enzyme
VAQQDVVIVGGGFYGSCLALFLRSVARSITIVEARKELLTRASFVNQARIHTGFHYPRSFTTAKRSLELYRTFMADFTPAVMSDFRMLYAIASQGSKVGAHRFFEMFRDMGAPIRPASRADQSLFNPQLIDGVFECEEYAFDAGVLRQMLRERLEDAGVTVRFDTRAVAFATGSRGGVAIRLEGGDTLEAPLAFNATYGRLNQIVREGEHDRLPVKNELTEVALVEVPEPLARLGVTVMDGPFFSLMPFPARGLHSLTHVRYTPQTSWLDGDGPMVTVAPQSRWLHMKRDAARFLPSVEEVAWRDSLFEIKTVLLRNEVDDGRPIFVHQHKGIPGLYSVLGGKVDNIYDLFDALRAIGGQFAGADLRWLVRTS